MTMFDHARSPRIGQRTPVETTGIQLVTLETLPEAAFRGQMVYRIDDHILQVFDGVAWVTATSSGSGARPIHVGPTPPVADDIGDGWLNTSDYLFYVWDGSEWRVTSADRQVETNQRSLKLAKAIEQLVPLGNMASVVVTYNTVAPVGVVNGDVWANVGTNTVWHRVSGTWVQVVDPEIVSRVLAAGQERAVVTDATITVFYDEVMPIGLDANDIGDVWWDTTIYRAWTGASWVDIQITGEELAPGAVSNEHLTPGSVSEDNITFDARDIGGVRTTIGSTTPTGNIEGDLWVDTGNGRELKRWNGADWVSVRDEWTTQARADALQALSDAADAISTAGDADAAAQQAQTNASQAISDAEAAILAAGTAQSTANAADGKADTALSDAASAVTTAGQADSKADQAIIDAGTAQSTAEGAATTAGSAQSLAQQVSDDLDLLGTDLETLNTTILPGLQDDLENLETTVGGHTTQIGNAQDELSTLSGTTIPSLQSDLSDANAALSLHDGRITSAQTAADDAQSAADTADGKAEAAQSAASTADGKAEAAQGVASAAQSTAEAAQTAASNAADAASTAQTAANDAAADALAAAGLAGSKGKVLIQPTTPATEDRLPQNLWIDTTDGENTPKRWNGSIWEPVTDKAATDAAATAASAQTTATNAATAASNAQGAASAAQSAAEAAQTTATNAATAASNAQDAADDALDGVDAVTGRMTTAEGEISSVTTRLTTAEGEITTVASDVSSLDTTVSGHTTRLSTAEGNITTISGDVSSLSGSVSSLSTRIGDAEDEIENIVTVQLAGKSKVTYSTNPPGSTPNSAGDVWYRRDATKQIIGQWIGLGGTAWDAVTLTDSVITNLSAGTIVTGEMHGDRIQANTIATSHIVTAGLDAATVKFGTMSGDRIEANTLNASKIVAGSITTDRMTANTISGDRITANTLNASKIVAGSITTDRMTANTINGDRIATNTLNANRIVANSITAGEIAANAISTSELDADAITAKHTITGATIQTTATANRGVKITSGGLLGYNNSGVAQFTLTSAGALSLTGAIKSGSTIEGASITGTVSVTGGVIQTGAGNSKVVRINSAGIVAYGEEEDDAVLAFETATGNLTIKGDITSGSVISGAEIHGGTINGGEITGGVIEGTSITGTAIYSSDIEVGENIRIGSTYGLQATFGDGHLIIPKDGDEASISGFDGEFKSFIANGNMTINGGDNSLSGRMSLTSSIPDPPNAPTVGFFHFWTDKENEQVQSEGKGLLRGGRHTSTGDKTLLVYSHPRIQVGIYYTSAIGFEWRDDNFDVIPGALNLGYQTGYASVDDVEITSTDIYMLARGKKSSPTSATSDSKWWLLRWTRTFSGSTETTDLSAAPAQARSLGISSTYRAGIAWDPVLSRLVLAFTGGGQIFLAEYNSSFDTVGNAQIVKESNGTTFYEWGSDDGIGGFAIGTFDFGDSVNRFMIWRQSADELYIGVRTGPGTTSPDTNIKRRTVDEQFPRANAGQTWGTVWNSVAGAFRSYNRVGADYIRQWQYSENRTVSDCSYAYAWVDTNSTGGTHTTKISPYAHGAPRRRFTNIFHRRPPTSGGNPYDEPNDTRFYINNVLQSTGGWKNNDTNTWFGTYLTTGPAPPASNTFAGLSGSGTLESAAKNPYAPTEPMWQLSGDGSGRMGLFRWDVNGGIISSPDPAGEIKMYAGETLPQGFLWCDGSAVSRTTYSKLFAAIGTKYGAGNGSTTFNLPNFGDRNPRGAGLFGGVGDTGGSLTSTLLAINIPPHTHGSGSLSTNSAGNHSHNLGLTSTNSSTGQTVRRGGPTGNIEQWGSNGVEANGAHSHNVTGTTSSTGLGEPFSTTDPYVVVNFIIRTN